MTQKVTVFKYSFAENCLNLCRNTHDKICWIEFWAAVQIFMEPLSEAQHLH